MKMVKEFDMMILFVVEIVAVVDDDHEWEYGLMMLLMMNTIHCWLPTKIISIKNMRKCFLRKKNVSIPMDIDCLQLKLMRYRRDLL
jgi:hypothetical protein